MKLAFAAFVFGLTLFGSVAGWVALDTRAANACTLGWFSVKYLSESVGQHEVVAIGTFGELQGAAIKFNVETYFKAPASHAETLLVNNLAHTTTPACEPVLTHLLVHEPGERALILLKRDDEGVGANWQASLVVGVLPIRNDAISSSLDGGGTEQVPLSRVREIIESATAAGFAPTVGLAESSLAPVGNLKCIYGPYTLNWFAANSPIIVVGRVESADPRTATIAVSSGILGARDGEKLRIDNRYLDAGHAISTCEESASPGPKYAVGDELLLFLTKEGSRDLGGLRPAGVDGFGIYSTTAIYDWGGGQYSLDEAVAKVRQVVADRPAVGESGTAPAQPGVGSAREEDGESTNFWFLAGLSGAIGAAVGAVVTFGLLRFRRSPR